MMARRRFRAQKRLFRQPLLVLQIEEQVIFPGCCPEDAEIGMRWRDATVEDLMIIPDAAKNNFPLAGRE